MKRFGDMARPDCLDQDDADCLIERMKAALLRMQRYNWEQGVAAQAMLELGEVSLARAAEMCQQNGRFSVIGSHDPVTDSASAGEAVLYAAKITGYASPVSHDRS